MLIPAAVAYQYHEQFILGPALIIILAVMLFLPVKYPSSKGKVGTLLVFIGCAEILATLSIAFVWGFLIGLSTLITGITVGAAGIASRAKGAYSKAQTVVALILVGTGGVAFGLLTVAFWAFAFGLGALISGFALGAVYTSSRVKRLSSKAVAGAFLIAVSIAEILIVAPVAFTWGFLIGLTTLVVGIVIGATALQPWAKTHLTLQNTRALRKVVYVVLAIMIAASALLIAVRSTTNLIHEQWLENYYGSTAPNLTLRGTVTGIALNQEVNTGYSYHIFQAVITLNITEFVWAEDGWWGNQTSAAQYWQNHGSVAVFYEKTDVPELAVGQTVEMNGRLMMPLEDSLYSGKVVIPPGTNDCYIRPL